MENIITGLLVVPIIWAGRSIDWTEGDRTYQLIAVWFIVQVLQLLVLLFVRHKIVRINDQKMISVLHTPINLTGGGSRTQKQTKETMSVKEYDLREWNKQILSVVLPTLVIMYLQYKYATVVPLFTQTILSPFRLVRANLFRIHILKQKGDDLVRPFKSSNPITKLMKEMKQEIGMNEPSKRGKKKLKKPNESQKAAIRAKAAEQQLKSKSK